MPKQVPPTSTSPFWISADSKLNALGILKYLVSNIINNQLPNFAIDPRLKVEHYHIPESFDATLFFSQGSSPSRTLSDIFWHSIPWHSIYESLGNLRVLDVGCGSGSYAKRLLDINKSHLSSYLGIDLEPRSTWDNLSKRYSNVQFIAANAHDIRSLISPETNLIISQSTIEHIPGDLLLFRQLADFINCVGHGVLQIHLFPSAMCLPLYLFHGVRQYTPRTVSKLIRTFDKNTQFALYQLGGQASNRLHWQFITQPQLLRRPDRRVNEAVSYARKLEDAIERDNKIKTNKASFYALVIQSSLDKLSFKTNQA